MLWKHFTDYLPSKCFRLWMLHFQRIANWGQQLLPIRLNEHSLTSKLTSMCCKVWKQQTPRRRRKTGTLRNSENVLCWLTKSGLHLHPLLISRNGLQMTNLWSKGPRGISGWLANRPSDSRHPAHNIVAAVDVTSMRFRCLSTMIDWLAQSNRRVMSVKKKRSSRITDLWRFFWQLIQEPMVLLFLFWHSWVARIKK